MSNETFKSYIPIAVPVPFPVKVKVPIPVRVEVKVPESQTDFINEPSASLQQIQDHKYPMQYDLPLATMVNSFLSKQKWFWQFPNHFPLSFFSLANFFWWINC